MRRQTSATPRIQPPASSASPRARTFVNASVRPSVAVRKGRPPKYRPPFALARLHSVSPPPVSPTSSSSSFGCQPCSVSLQRMDFDRWFRERGRAHSPTSSLEQDTSDNRLVKQENGMVLLPRTFYNKHPAKMVNQRRASTRSYEALKKKTPPKKKRDINSNSTKDDAIYDCEYRLVLYYPDREPVETPPINFTLKNLSESIETERLPSPMWEVERIPPLINFRGKTDSSYDAIAAELEELMGESKKPEDEKMEVDHVPPKLEIDDEKPNRNETPQDAPPEAVPKSETEKAQDDYPSIMDILNEIPKETNVDNVQNKPNDADEAPGKTAETQIDRPATTTVIEEAPTDSIEKSDDILEDKLEIDISQIDDSMTNKVDDQNVENKDEAKPKDNEGTTKIESRELPMKDQSSVDGVAEVTPVTKSEETSKADVSKIESENNNEDYLLKSVIFRRLTEDKQTYDRLVTFQENMEYFIAINDRKVELLGAPEYINSIDDLQILLQIVDDVTLNSFNVICMS